VRIWNKRKVRHIAPYELVTAMRASFFVAGPILAKTGYAKVPLPGGCSIGKRPVDIHLDGFKAMGAAITMEHGFVGLTAPKLKGVRFKLPFPSVGATENLMMAACLASGETCIENAAREPEIEDLMNLLNQSGAIIEGGGTETVRIQGVSQLSGVAHYPVIADRVEAGTLLIAGAITGGDVTVTHVSVSHLKPLLDVLTQCGCHITVTDSSVRCQIDGPIRPVLVKTLPFPGFPTDMQAQLMALLTISNGVSCIEEAIFENRFMHASELKRMGANIKINETKAIVTGVSSLSGAEVKITDLRAGAALILAGLVAEGRTTVYGLKHLRRGYDDLPGKLISLGARFVEQ